MLIVQETAMKIPGWLKNRKTAGPPKNSLGDWVKGSTHLFYHLFIIALSVSIVLSMPLWVSFIAGKLLIYWSFIGNEKMFLASVEIVLAVLLILFSNFIGMSWRNKKLAAMARRAGLVLVTPARGVLTRRRIRRLKERQGFARDIMVLRLTGFRTFVESQGELAQVIQQCREAKIMLLNPNSAGACPGTEPKNVLDPGMSPEGFGEQIRKSIDYLKELKAAKKNIRLKLYDGTPFVKLTILGDYLWFQHYQTGQDVETIPKYVFKHDQNPGSLYVPFYQFFQDRWNCPDIPEYDWDTDELIYRDGGGNEFRREKLNQKEGPPDFGRSLTLTLRNDPNPDHDLSLPSQALEDHSGDEDLITEVFRNLNKEIHSRRN